VALVEHYLLDGRMENEVTIARCVPLGLKTMDTRGVVRAWKLRVFALADRAIKIVPARRE
jgi:hypothetical protein